MSTDTAFARRARASPVQVRAFMLTVTVVDDLGALLVIATAYARSLHPFVLLLAGGLFALVAVLVRIESGDA